MLNEALRLIRVYHDLRQSEMATKIGISKSYLSEIEKGHKKPTLELVQKYSDAFDVPASSIMFFSENMNKAGSYEKARGIVAAKIIRLMQFLEERSGRVHAD
jgi:transcriptional regulator with XRE-family HTH domain